MISEFAKKVFEVVKKVPKGSTMTYGQVAILAGSPRAARAVGTVLSKNYDPQVSCHRVTLASGEAGGYNRGKKNKAKILEKESAL